MNQPDWLTKFLEFIVLKGHASNLVFNTLLELYLRSANSTLPEDSTVKSSNSSMVIARLPIEY